MAVTSTSLVVEIEQDEPTHDRWSGEFSSRYIEDITAKTGNFKKFPVFVRMLQTALASSSSSVFVDLLTFSDLQMLRARKLSQNNGSHVASSALLSSPNGGEGGRAPHKGHDKKRCVHPTAYSGPTVPRGACPSE